MPENGNSEVENNAETDYRTGIRTHIDRMRRGEHNEETMMALDRLNRLYEVENQERAIDETNAWFDELSPMGYNGLRDLNLVREFFEDGYFKGGMLVEMYKHWQGNNLWKDKYADNALTIKQGNETLGQGETEVDFDSIEPVGKGAFGNIYDQFKGKVKQAIDFLLHKKEGEALSALNHKEVGDIDLVWGKEGTGKSNGFGLAKIAKYHPEVLNNLQDILDDMVVVSRTENRIRLESKTHEAAISLEYYGENKKWLLTAYEKRESLNTKTMNTDISQNTQEGDSLLEDSHNSKSATTLVTPDSTNGSRAVASDLELENGTTTPQKSISNTNIQNNSDTSATLSGQNKELVTNDDLNKKIDEEVDRRMQEAGVLTTLNNSWTIENVSQQEVNNELDALLGDLFNRQDERIMKEGRLAYINKATLPLDAVPSIQGNQSADLHGNSFDTNIQNNSDTTTTETNSKAVEDLSVKRMSLSDIHTDENRFQGRKQLNEAVLRNISENFNDAYQDPIHIWKDPKSGKYYVLSGHHRYYGAKNAGRNDVKIVDRSNDFTESQAIKFAKEEANANRSMETPLERGTTLRNKIEGGATLEEVQEFLNREGKNRRFVENLSYLNPKGFVYQTLQRFYGTQNADGLQDMEKFAGWIGEIRKTFKDKITDAHEKEVFDFLMNRDLSKRFTNKQDFIEKVRAIVETLDYDSNQPLNLSRVKDKTNLEREWDNTLNELTQDKKKVEKEIDTLRERFTNPAMEGFIDPNSASYTELKRRSDEKIGLLQNQVRSLEQKIVEHRQKKRDVIRAGMNQTSLFDFHSVQGKMQEITRKSLDKIVKRLLKSVPNANVHIVNQQQVERMIADSLRLEKERIVAQAKANGTYMKAPNGKPTNLNEEQWVTVRTEAFKDWFGDWESASLIAMAENALRDKNSKSKYIFSPSEKTAKRFSELLEHEINSVVITDDSIRHINKKHGQNEAMRGQIDMTAEDIVVLPYVINNFDTMELSEDFDDKQGNKAIKITKRVNGTYVVATIEKGKDKNFVVTSWQKKKSDALDASKETPRLNVRNDSDLTKVQKEIEQIKSAKENSSKVVDENGEPMVVYHGYRSEDFYEFEQREAYVSSFLYGNKKVKRNGFFFSPDFEFSKKYELRPYGSKERIMRTFLNIKNPFNFSQNLHLKGINENISQLFEKFLEEAETNGIQVFNNDFSLLVPSESAWGYLDDEIGVFFVEFLKKRGYDGVFLEEKDVDKISMEQEKAIDFSTIVALHPNQIKSATANVGTFSEDSDDIRYHTDSELSEQKRVNATFNEELAQMREGSLPSGHIFQLGRPNTLLQSAGIPNLPIELKANKLKEKSEQENHPFDLSEMESLPQAIQNPIAVFDSSTMVGRKVIFTELVHEGKNFVVALELNSRRTGIQVNSIRSVYPRNNTQIVRAITNNEAVYINKEKATDWLGRQQFNSADATQLANRSANIINNFENPKQNNNLQELRTNNGTVYGMARGNNIYLNADAGLNANTAIHEFGHLWVHSLRNGNKALYNKAIATVLRDKKAMELMRNNPNYIHLKSDEAIAEEILATEIGNLGERKYQAEQSKSVLHRLAKHIWQWVRNTLSKGTKLERWSDAKWQSASLLDVANNISDNLLQGKKVPMVRLSKAEIVQNANVLRGLNSVQLRTVLFANDLVMEARCP
ncbi:hypothetical protein AB4865_09495 [Capnocytophaga sp. ARDL2]|uniref:MuF-C-terminal domain-containing protein n=1 Tax=Capnocytophaga sp. ARDL2 TaxID=3238809 RepID=UPI0035576229